METHRQTQHSICRGPQWDNTPPTNRPKSLQGLFSKIIRVIRVTIQGLRGSDGNSYQPTDSFCAPPPVGQDGNSGGGQPSPPPLTCMQHVCALGGTQPPPTYHFPLRTGRGTEVMEYGGGGGAGIIRDGIQGIRTSPVDGDVFSVHQVDLYQNRQ